MHLPGKRPVRLGDSEQPVKISNKFTKPVVDLPNLAGPVCHHGVLFAAPEGLCELWHVPEHSGHPGDVRRVHVAEELPGQPAHSLALAVHGRVRHEEQLEEKSSVEFGDLFESGFWADIVKFDLILYNL